MKGFVVMVIIVSLVAFCHCQSGGINVEQLVQIGFTQTEHTVREDERAVTVTVAVLQGTLDNETTAIVVLHTQDGSAKASEDYEPISDHVLVFNATILTHNVTITILEDDIREEMEMFSLSLTSQSNATTDTDMMGSHFEIPLGILGVLIIDTSNIVDEGLAIGLAIGLPVAGVVLAITVPIVIVVYCYLKKNNKVSPM